MRGGILCTLFVSIVTASVCSAEPQGNRNDAAAIVERLRKTAPPAILSEEYGSIEKTFSRAEELSKESKFDEAERMYKLTSLKSAVYEQKVREISRAPGNGRLSTNRMDSVPSGDAKKDAEDRNTSTPPLEMQGDEESDNSPIASKFMIGKVFTYTVKRRESLRMVGAKLGVNWRSIARDNALDPKKTLEAGQKLKIDTRRIIPKIRAEGIVINIPDRTLYIFKDKKLNKAVPVALGMTTVRNDVVWRTPTGKFRITSKVKDPTWFIPPSIRKKMKQSRKNVQVSVPPGKRNPLGKYALKTSLSGILIHGTISPESIYTYSSHGCIRVMPGNMAEIFNEIRVNTGGEIIYQPVKLALSDDGRVFLEVHRDAYDQYGNLEEVAKSLIVKNNAEQIVDWEMVKSSVKNKKGVPVDVTQRARGGALQASSRHVFKESPLP